MKRKTTQILADIRDFQPIGGDWRPLDSLIAELWATNKPAEHIPALLALLERFPEEDGAGVLWGVVHGLESLPGYEPDLVRSVQRQPSELGIIMLGRLLNAGTREVNGMSLLNLLRAVASRDEIPARLAEMSAKLAELHAKPRQES